MENTQREKYFVLDTNVLMLDPLSFTQFHEHTVIIPMVVLEELDYNKDKGGEKSRLARSAINALERLVSSAGKDVVSKGISLHHYDFSGDATGVLKVDTTKEYNPGDCVDNLIIETALELQEKHSEVDIHVVSKDINMRLKARTKGVNFVDDYLSDQLIEDVRYITPGYRKYDGSFWDAVDECVTETRSRDTIHIVKRKAAEEGPEFHLNEYLYDDNGFLGRVIHFDEDTVHILDLSKVKEKAWGDVTPRNIQQRMAINALNDDQMELVSLIGPASSGKTFLALACAICKVADPKHPAKRIIVTRSTPPIAEDIGLLPGDEHSKMLPWLMAFRDSLEALVGTDVEVSEHREHKASTEDATGSVQYLIDKFNVEFRSMNYMRGRTLKDTVLILDETQNNNLEQVKTMLTRIGSGSSMIITGNLGQVDAYAISAQNSGLTHAVEVFKNYEGAATIMLQGGQRSALAQYAEENM